jgi:hypothetical protein
LKPFLFDNFLSGWHLKGIMTAVWRDDSLDSEGEDFIEFNPGDLHLLRDFQRHGFCEWFRNRHNNHDEQHPAARLLIREVSDSSKHRNSSKWNDCATTVTLFRKLLLTSSGWERFRSRQDIFISSSSKRGGGCIWREVMEIERDEGRSAKLNRESGVVRIL